MSSGGAGRVSQAVSQSASPASQPAQPVQPAERSAPSEPVAVEASFESPVGESRVRSCHPIRPVSAPVCPPMRPRTGRARSLSSRSPPNLPVGTKCTVQPPPASQPTNRPSSPKRTRTPPLVEVPALRSHPGSRIPLATISIPSPSPDLSPPCTGDLVTSVRDRRCRGARAEHRPHPLRLRGTPSRVDRPAS